MPPTQVLDIAELNISLSNYLASFFIFLANSNINQRSKSNLRPNSYQPQSWKDKPRSGTLTRKISPMRHRRTIGRVDIPARARVSKFCSGKKATTWKKQVAWKSPKKQHAGRGTFRTMKLKGNEGSTGSTGGGKEDGIYEVKIRCKGAAHSRKISIREHMLWKIWEMKNTGFIAVSCWSQVYLAKYEDSWRDQGWQAEILRGSTQLSGGW